MSATADKGKCRRISSMPTTTPAIAAVAQRRLDADRVQRDGERTKEGR